MHCLFATHTLPTRYPSTKQVINATSPFAAAGFDPSKPVTPEVLAQPGMSFSVNGQMVMSVEGVYPLGPGGTGPAGPRVVAARPNGNATPGPPNLVDDDEQTDGDEEDDTSGGSQRF